MEKLEEAGIKGFVGKVNMDRNSPDYLCEASAAQSAKDTEEWIKASKQFENIRPILTPRFIPTCTDELIMTDVPFFAELPHQRLLCIFCAQ